MTLFKLQFAGEIKKVEHRTAGTTPIVELSICKKNKTKEGEEASFSWAKITVFQPATWQTFTKGGFVAGVGDWSMRSYKDKDGNKAVAAEVKCDSFSIEVHNGAEQAAPSSRPDKVTLDNAWKEPTQRTAPRVNVNMSQPTREAIQGMGSDSPPFHPHDKWSWG